MDAPALAGTPGPTARSVGPTPGMRVEKRNGSLEPVDLNKMKDAEIDRITAKHQVTVFGYACDQTKALIPL